MLRKLPKENMGKSNLGWLESRFHFSFAEYRNADLFIMRLSETVQ